MKLVTSFIRPSHTFSFFCHLYCVRKYSKSIQKGTSKRM